MVEHHDPNPVKWSKDHHGRDRMVEHHDPNPVKWSILECNYSLKHKLYLSIKKKKNSCSKLSCSSSW
jgi:hypothetical protein